MFKSLIALLWLLFAAAAPLHAQPARTAPDRVLVIGTKEAPPFSMKGEDGTWSGISVDLWRKVADQLHLRYRFKETTLQGLIDETAGGQLDAAVAALTVTSEREQVVDFTQPYYSTGLGIAVSRVSVFDWWRLIGSLFSLGFLWAMLGLVGVTILVGVVVWLIERRHSEHFGGVRKGLVSSVWWSALTMTQAGPDETPGTFWGRIIAIVWMGASVIAIAVFTAGITSQITAKQLQGVVHGVEDLRSARVGAIEGTATLEYLTKRGVRFRTYPTMKDGLEALKAGSLDAFVHDRPLLAWYVNKDFSSSLDMLDTVFAKQNYAIALPMDSPIRIPINLVMLELMHSPWWEELNAKYLGKE